MLKGKLINNLFCRLIFNDEVTNDGDREIVEVEVADDHFEMVDNTARVEIFRE
jgi:hypothetical protein